MLFGLGVWLYQFVLNSPDMSDDTIPAMPTMPTTDSNNSAALPASTITPSFAGALGDEDTFPKIFIPTAGISQVIIDSLLEPDGWQVDHLGDRVGHLQGTAWLGETGNIVLAGHVENSDGNPSVFAEIGDLVVGDLVILSHLEQEYSYRVIEIKVVESSDLSVVYPVPGEEWVTLITCTGYDFISGEYEQRTVVIAERV